jgi:hypothetical protein
MLHAAICLARSIRSARGPSVDFAFRQRRQLLVGHVLFIERLLQHAGAVVAAELPRALTPPYSVADGKLTGR